MDTKRREEWLAEIGRSGWQEGMEASSASVGWSGRQDVMDVGQALLAYWRKDPSLANYAHQLNGGGRLFAAGEDKKALIGLMNRAYFSVRQEGLPEGINDTYEEILFWRGLQSPEGLAYFERLSGHFAQQVAAEGKVGPELAELLQSKDLDPQMRELRRLAVDALRGRIVAELSRERSPVKRLGLLTNVMTGVGGARLVDADLWKQARNWTLAAAQLGEENYTALRNVLTNAMDGEMLDHPRETLTRLQSMLDALDKGASYGSGGKAAQQEAYTPMEERETRRHSGISSKTRNGIILLCVVIVVLIVLILSDPRSGEKINEERQQRTEPSSQASETPSSTPREEREEENPSPEATPTPEESPSPTATPSPSPTPTPMPEEEVEEEIPIEGEEVIEDGLEEMPDEEWEEIPSE